ncbi:MAG: hypothetical protein ACRC35_12740 [Angustibacter sp.]
MAVAYDLVVAGHLLGMAAVVGGWLTVLGRPRVLLAQLWGARAQVVTGLLLVGLGEAELGTEGPVDHARVAVKLVLALIIAGAAESLYARERRTAQQGVNQQGGNQDGGNRDGIVPEVDPRAHAVGGLGLLTTVVAVIWS